MIRPATQLDLPSILEIYNEAILCSTAIYDYKPHTLADRVTWYEKKIDYGFPVLVLEENHIVVGFAAFGTFRAFPAYKYTIEHSLYVHKNHRNKGYGRALLLELIKIADAEGYATMLGVIDASNKQSLDLHEKLGFRHAGTIQKAGYKFGRWLDVVFYEYALSGPVTPVED